MALPRSSLPLERKLPLLILALLGVVVIASLSVSYYEIRHSAELSAADRLSGLSHSTASLSEQNTAVRLTQMRRVARDDAVRGALASPSQPLDAAARHALATLILAPADTVVPAELWTPDGMLVGAPPGGLVLPTEAQAARNEILATASGNDSGRMTRLYAAGTRASTWAVVPVRQNGAVLGYVVQERRISTTPQSLQPLRALIGTDVEFYFHNVGDSTWVALTGRSVRAPRVQRFADSLQLLHFPSRATMLASTTPIAGTPYELVVAQPLTSILSRPLATLRALSALALALVVLGALIGWVISRRIARPLVELTDAAEALAQGEYSHRVRSAGPDEVGRLATAFNRMAGKVQEASDASHAAVSRLTTAMETQAFLADVSRTLAGSFSDEKLLSELAQLCVPRIADYCTVHIVEDDGTIRRVETVHYDPAKTEVVRALVRGYRYRVDGPGEVAQVIRTQQPVMISHIDLAAIRRGAPDAATVRLLDEIKPTSFLCVPLVARGRAFGAISFTMTDSGRIFSEDDVQLAIELARRSAVVIDNALIYQRSLALRLEAEAASNAKSDFLAKMSHEIRTPINAMMGYAELMQLGISGSVNDKQAQQLARIRASGEHLTALVNEILDLAKIEAGGMTVEPVVASAGDAADAALALIRPLATSKGVEILASIGGDPHTKYVGDPQRVQQILTNLLSNAVKFTEPGGRVSVECGSGLKPVDASWDGKASANWATITVVDTGVGIASEDLERIFQPFVQVDQGYTRAHGGTGLGLTISRDLAQMMGGEITVESTPGKSSRFSLWLPAAEPVASAVHA